MFAPAHCVRRFVFILFLAAFLLPATLLAQNPTPGQNVNMVSGTQWPGGDPFLQRQNEPSLAISSRNERHLLAGANDYRSVDIPFADVVPGSMAGDAWLGVFKSLDGGQTWQSTLLPGYPQDLSPAGLASPLRGLTTAADPTVRPGTHGLFYYSGIAFNRGTNQGAVFVARFIDLDNKENGDVPAGTDPIRYINTVVVDAGTSGQFIDKPWLAVDVPRTGAPNCSIPVSPTQTVPAGMVYLVWSRFTGSNSTKIMLSRSDDCGATWGNPIKLSESNSINQGTVISVDPVSGAVYVAWRRFKSSSETDAILFSYSTNSGKTFSKAQELAQIIPFDQGTTTASFRTNALPTMAVSVDGASISRIHIAWAGRAVLNGDARIFLTNSTDAVNWSAPAAVDPVAIEDDFSNSFPRGHQFMPQLTFTAGKLSLLYYDSRLDHTVTHYHPNTDPNDPSSFLPDAFGRFYREERVRKGELEGDPLSGAVFTPFISDAGLLLRRHTIDLRVAQSNPGPSLNFVHATVSKYPFGTLGTDEVGTIDTLKQLQVNPPNFPMFQLGTVPFIGDYIDIVGPTFLPPATPGGMWRFNLAPAAAPVHYAVWTSNQDVRPPADGNWTNYTPVGGGGPSIFDPTTNTPVCVTGQEGMRNQNIYFSRITQGLNVSSPQNAKPLNAALTRAFSVLLENQTSVNRDFRLIITGQPAGGKASFLPLQFPAGTPESLRETLEISVGAHGGIARTLFARSSNATDNITVEAYELDPAPNQPLDQAPIKAGGLSGFVILNPDPTVPSLVNPDGADPSQDISTIEIYTPNISNPNISNPNIANPNVANPNISNPNISNPNISNPNISNPNIANPNISNPNISNPNIANPNISNPNIANPNISNAVITDATYEVTNSGNTTTSYTVKLIGNTPPSTSLQLIVSQPYLTPVGLNCSLEQQTQMTTLANVPNPALSSIGSLTDPNLTDPSLNNTTFSLGPGETAFVTLRGYVTAAEMTSITDGLAPAVVAQPNTGTLPNEYATLLIIATNNLPDGTGGVAYSQKLETFGGTAPYSWSLASGSLPDGLSLFFDGTDTFVAGTPTKAGSFTFELAVTDASATPQTKTKQFTVNIVKATATLAITSDSPDPSAVGQPVTVAFSLSLNPAAAAVPLNAVITVTDTTGAMCTATVADGSCAISPKSAGDTTFTAVFQETDAYTGSTATAPHSVGAGGTTVIIDTDLLTMPSVVGQPITTTVQVDPTYPGGVAPTGTVTITLSGSGEPSITEDCPLSDGSCSVTPATSGDKTIVVSYSGDSNYSGSSSDPVTHTVNPASTATTILSTSPNPSVVGQPVTVNFSVSVQAPGSGTATGSVAVSGGGASCNGTLTSGAGSCTLAFTSPGDKTLTAVYAGDGNFGGSTSAAATHQVNPGNTTTSIVSDSPDPSVVGQAYTVQFAVTVNAPASGTPTGVVTVSEGSASCNGALSAGAGSCVLVSTTAGAKTLTATYGGSAGFSTSSGIAAHQVNKANTTTTIVSDDPDPSAVGQPVLVTFSVAVQAPGTGTPTGTVTVSDGSGASCTATLPATSCTLTITTFGRKTLTATYTGDANFNGSAGSAAHSQVNYTLIGFFTPLTTAGTITNPTFSGTFNQGKAIPIKFQLQDWQGNFVGDIAAVRRISAIFDSNCAGPPDGAEMVLYSPTTGATGGSTFRVDSGTKQYIFNWDTSVVAKSGTGCYTLVVTPNDDGTPRATNIRLR